MRSGHGISTVAHCPTRSLFAGAIGYFKNPGSQREVELTAIEAAEAIMLASSLLRIVDGRAPRLTAN
jgi:hypothetical protein